MQMNDFLTDEIETLTFDTAPSAFWLLCLVSLSTNLVSPLATVATMYFVTPYTTVGGIRIQTGSMRPLDGPDQDASRCKPSLNTSRMPGRSLAISLWTVSTSEAEKNGVTTAMAADFSRRCCNM